MRDSTRKQASLVATAAAMLALVGCESRPRAPALSDSPVYENRQAGCRFLAPEGWRQSVNSMLPPQLDREFRLVEYTTLGASFEVLCLDDPDGEHQDQHAYHARPSHGVQLWKSTAEPEQIEINGAAGERFVYEAERGGRKVVKHVVVFPREGSRYFSFVGLHWPEQDKVGQQISQSIHSTVWFD